MVLAATRIDGADSQPRKTRTGERSCHGFGGVVCLRGPIVGREAPAVLGILESRAGQ
jgi:hypothetical protein